MLLFSWTKEKKLKISNVLKMADEKQFEAGKTSSGKCITLYYSCLVLFFFALIFYKITFFVLKQIRQKITGSEDNEAISRYIMLNFIILSIYQIKQ